MPRGDERALTLDAYIRVSQVRGREGASFISPLQQRERIEAWCRAYGHRVAVVHEELDESGKRADRPKLLAAIERVEQRQTDGIAVARLDRFGRSLIDGLALIDRVQRAGGTFVSVADGFDLTTDTGRLVLRIMLSLAEFELERIRGSWHDAKARAVMRGVHPSATPPFGYRRASDGRLEPDPKSAALVTELFERRAAGEAYADLGRWLADVGAITQRGGTNWPLRAVKDIIRNEAYLGVAFAHSRTSEALSVRNPDAHEALTTTDAWHRAQRPGARWAARGHDPHPLAPLLRCAGCRYSMRPTKRHPRRDGVVVTSFACKTAHSAAHSCPEPASITDSGALSELVTGAFLAALPELAATSERRDPALAAAESEVAEAQAAFEEWRDDPSVQRRLGMPAYVDGLARRQELLNSALAKLSTMRIAADPILLPAQVADVRQRWPELGLDERRELMRAAIRCVFVRRAISGRPGIEPRLRIVWQGESVELPRRGGRGWKPLPFRFDDADPNFS